MELERQVLHKNKEIGKAFSQITLDDDYNLPDFKKIAVWWWRQRRIRLPERS